MPTIEASISAFQHQLVLQMARFADAMRLCGVASLYFTMVGARTAPAASRVSAVHFTRD